MAKNKKKTFEQHLEQLQALADDLEAGDLPLAEALKKYEEAIQSFRLAQQLLKKAEERIEILLRNAEGELEAHPFGAGAEESKEPTEEDESGDSDDELFA